MSNLSKHSSYNRLDCGNQYLINMTAKVTELKTIFTDSKKRHQIQKPSQEMDIARVTSIKSLGVTMTNNLCVLACLWRHKFMRTDYARYTSNSRSWHEWFSAAGHLRLGRRRQDAICVKCLVGGGFTTAVDRQCLDGFIRRSKRWGFCSHFAVSCFFLRAVHLANKQLFHKILVNSCRLINSLLPPHSAASQNYQLRRRPHDIQLPIHSGKFIDSNFIIRQLDRPTDIY